MDIAQLTQFLLPFLPYLLKMGEKAAEEAGKKLGEAAWEGAKTLWTKLRPHVQAKPAAQEAIQDATARPQDADAQAALRRQLTKLLDEDADLRQEIERLWDATPPQVVQQVIAAGNRSVAIGGDVRGSIIVTGDGNVLEK